MTKQTEKSVEDEMAEIEQRKTDLAAKIKDQNQPLIDEAAKLLADKSVQGGIVRLAEIGAALPNVNPYINLKMMLNSLSQTFGGVANAMSEANRP